MFKIPDWSSFQSYKDRNPPWIRLHKKLLDDYNFHRMSDAAQALLPMLWLLAAEDKDPVSGMLRFSYEEVSFRLRKDVSLVTKAIHEIISAGFLESVEHDKVSLEGDNFEVKTDSYGIVTRELRNRHSETETETETETDYTSVLFLYNQTAERIGLNKAQKLTSARKCKIKTRLKDCGGIEGWKVALEKIEDSPFCRGENTSGWKADFDFLLQESSFIKLMEGRYDQAKTTTKKADRAKTAAVRAFENPNAGGAWG